MRTLLRMAAQAVAVDGSFFEAAAAVPEPISASGHEPFRPRGNLHSRQTESRAVADFFRWNHAEDHLICSTTQHNGSQK
jgi:hypothetical protein